MDENRRAGSYRENHLPDSHTPGLEWHCGVYNADSSVPTACPKMQTNHAHKLNSLCIACHYCPTSFLFCQCWCNNKYTIAISVLDMSGRNVYTNTTVVGLFLGNMHEKNLRLRRSLSWSAIDTVMKYGAFFTSLWEGQYSWEHPEPLGPDKLALQA